MAHYGIRLGSVLYVLEHRTRNDGAASPLETSALRCVPASVQQQQMLDLQHQVEVIYPLPRKSSLLSIVITTSPGWPFHEIILGTVTSTLKPNRFAWAIAIRFGAGVNPYTVGTSWAVKMYLSEMRHASSAAGPQCAFRMQMLANARIPWRTSSNQPNPAP